MQRLFIIVLLLLCHLSAKPQNKAVIDSLSNSLDSSPDTSKVLILNQLAWSYRNSDLAKAVDYGEQSIALAQSIKYYKGLAEAYNMVGVVQRNIGNYSKATDFYFKALQIAEQHNIIQQISYSNLNLGDIFKYQKNYEQATVYIKKAIQSFENIKDQRGVGYGYIRLGEVYQEQGMYQEALIAYEKSLEVRTRLKDKSAIESTTNRLGNLYELMNDYPQAIKYLSQSLEIGSEISDLKSIAGTQADLSRIYFKQGNHDKAIEYAERSLELGQKLDTRETVKRASQVLAEAYAKKEDYKKAYHYQSILMEMKDSLFNQESFIKINNLQKNYETQRKQVEIDLLNKDKQIQNLILNLLIGGLLLFLFLIFALYRINRHRNRVNKILNSQNKIIEKRNEDITASINYAKRIQDAYLPSSEQIAKYLPEHFIFFKPKDIVSGDFYWFAEVENKIVLACVDCTGHGVPGAFMSLIGNNLLNQIVLNMGVTMPEVILSAMNAGVNDVLQQKQTQNRDSMDVALCVIDLRNKVLEFAGAKSPLLYIQNNQLYFIKGNRSTVGDIEREEEIKTFVKHVVDISVPTTFYLFSDGFPDQFGGKEGRKFLIKNFRELLLGISQRPMKEQDMLIQATFRDWIGNHPQIDDVTLIGVKLS
jgi:serine phosphatase RsbU (regulator of sigma subunit)/uncharacterized protein HemY